MLKSRCRYCKKPISVQYPAVELITGVLFVISYLAWPISFSSGLDYMLFAAWLLSVTVGVALVLYDLKWMLLPNQLVYSLAFFSILFVLIQTFSQSDVSVLRESVIGSSVYGGFFFLIYQISNGKWIGGGDVRLGFVLGLLLGWQKSILGLTLAAYLGTFVILILFLAGKYHKKMKLPFGPFLLGAAFITQLWGQQVIDWYLRISGIK